MEIFRIIWDENEECAYVIQGKNYDCDQHVLILDTIDDAIHELNNYKNKQWIALKEWSEKKKRGEMI